MNHAPILDYASPASRGRLRLPARSIIALDRDDERLIVRERLDGRGRAVLALLFAAFTFCIMAGLEKQMLPKWEPNQGRLLVLAALQGAQLVVGALVVNGTWRRTTLTVTPNDVTLRFAAPFSRVKRYHWPAEQVAMVEVVDSEPMLDRAIVPELELRMWTGAPVRLFAGHERGELLGLAAAIRAARPPLPTAEAKPALPIATATAAAAAAPPPLPHPRRLGDG